jgi:two-component system sensor histidine kinase DctS
MTHRAHPLSRSFRFAPRRSWYWSLPLTAALVLIGLVAGLLQYSDARDQEAAQRTLIADSLSLEKQLRSRIETEQARLAEVARVIGVGHVTPERFAMHEEINRGLRRRWLSVLWIDSAARIVAAAPEVAAAVQASDEERRGLSAHLEAPLVTPGGQTTGKLVARYSLSASLAQETPWWTAQRYVVRLVDDYDNELATTADGSERNLGARHRISFDPPFADVYLELQQRSAFVPWYQTTPMAMVSAVLALLVWASWLMRRQMRDTERAEAAWRGEASWRRAMEDALTVGLRARDMQGRMLYVNRRMCELTGFDESELVGRDPPMPYWSPDAMEETMRLHQRTLAGHAPREGFESRWRRKDGKEIVVMVFEAPLTDPSGRQVGWMGSVVDVTERKHAEELERQRAERAAHQARLMTMGEIAASLAHELNQPLTAVASYSAGVRNSLARVPGIDARILTALERQGEQAAHAGRIVERIRGFLSRSSPQQERCDVSEVVDRALELLRPDLRRRGIEVQDGAARAAAGNHAGPLLVHADPVLLEQVVINLVRNAADVLTGRPAPRRIGVLIDSENAERARIRVIDNGPGLGGRTIEQLAAPFYSTKAEGMGLGLAICRSILEVHLGHLDAAEAPGGGACFTITLPLLEVVDA